jgi:hypothetical protein
VCIVLCSKQLGTLEFLTVVKQASKLLGSIAWPRWSQLSHTASLCLSREVPVSYSLCGECRPLGTLTADAWALNVHSRTLCQAPEAHSAVWKMKGCVENLPKGQAEILLFFQKSSREYLFLNLSHCHQKFNFF